MIQPTVRVSSEIGTLEKVIVHRPDLGIERISPKKAEELLFDDIVHLPKMQEEHDIFTKVLKAFMGNDNVLEIGDLLFQSLEENEDERKDVVSQIIDYEELPSSATELLLGLPNDVLAKVLISGYYEKGDYILFDPIPNFIFTRDIAVTINDHVLITKASKIARFRENFLTRFIFWTHPLFKNLNKENKLINLNIVEQFPPSRKGAAVSMEGGDVMIINKDYLLIGHSERTTQHAIKSLIKVLFENDVVKNVVQVNIPADRSYMHIDTIFTQINTNHIVAFKPIIIDGLGSNVDVYRKDGTQTQYMTVKEFFLAEINPDMQFILSGDGESPYQEREQWTDGCNLVAIKPGVGLTYDRNPKTEKAFKKAGYRVIHVLELLDRFEKGLEKPEEVENTIITLPSNELSRARGGSHCMTCPVIRADI